MTSGSKTDNNKGVNLKQLLDAVKKINPQMEKMAERMLSQLDPEAMSVMTAERVIKMLTPIQEEQSAQIAEQVEKKLEEQSTWLDDNFSRLFDMVSKGHEATAKGLTSIDKSHSESLKLLQKSVSEISKGQFDQDSQLEKALKMLAAQDGKLADLGKGQAEIGEGVAKSQQNVSLVFDEVGRVNDSIADISGQVNSIHALNKSGFNQKQFKQMFRLFEKVSSPNTKMIERLEKNQAVQQSLIEAFRAEMADPVSEMSEMVLDLRRVGGGLRKLTEEFRDTMGPAVDEAGGLVDKMLELVDATESIHSSMSDTYQMVKTTTNEYTESIESAASGISRIYRDTEVREKRNQTEMLNQFRKMLSDEHSYLSEHAQQVTDVASGELKRAGRDLRQNNDMTKEVLLSLKDSVDQNITQQDQTIAYLRKELVAHLNSLKDHTLGQSQVETIFKLVEAVDSIRVNQTRVTGELSKMNGAVTILIDSLNELDVSDSPEKEG